MLQKEPLCTRKSLGHGLCLGFSIHFLKRHHHANKRPEPALQLPSAKAMVSLSPGHREHPDHMAVESAAGGRMTVELAGQRIADSRDVIRLEEDGRPAQFYFSRDDV